MNFAAAQTALSLERFSLLARDFYDYIANPGPVYNNAIFGALYSHVYALSAALLAVAASLLWVFAYLLAVALKLSVGFVPVLHEALRQIVEFHRTKLSATDIAIEAAVLLSLTLFLVYKRRILDAYKALERSVAQKSRVAARLFPHVLFFTLSTLVAVFGQKFLEPLSSPSVLPVFTLLVPVARTTMVLFRRSVSQYKHFLGLWVIVAAYYSVTTGCEMLPIDVAYYLPVLRQLALVVAVWVQLSSVCTNLVLSNVGPFISSVVENSIPLARLGKAVNTERLLSVLRTMGMLNDTAERFLKSLFQDTMPRVVETAG